MHLCRTQTNRFKTAVKISNSQNSGLYFIKLTLFNLVWSLLYAGMLSWQPLFDLTVLNKNIFCCRRDGADVQMLLLLQSSLRHADARVGPGGQYITFFIFELLRQVNIPVVGEINLSKSNEKGAQTSYNIRLQ